MKTLFKTISGAFGAIFLALLGSYFSQDEPSNILLVFLVISAFICVTAFGLFFIAERFENKQKEIDLLKQENQELDCKIDKCKSDKKKLLENNRGLKEQLIDYKKENMLLRSEYSYLEKNQQFLMKLSNFLLQESSEETIKKAEILRDFNLIDNEKN